MRAMILAAGLGTRLLPLTNSRPKALVPVRGLSMLEFWVSRLYQSGFEAVYLNAYHLKDRLVTAVYERQWPIPVQVLVEPVLLGTGGGIKSAASRFDEGPFAVVNVDILSDPDFNLLCAHHKLTGAEVSLLLHDWPEFNNVAVNDDGLVLGFGREAIEICKSSNGVRLMAFTGVHLINPSVMDHVPAKTPADILNIYRKLIERGVFPRAVTQNGLFWREMGSTESYRKITFELAGMDPERLSPIKTGETITIDPSAFVHPDSSLVGSVVIGRRSRICEGVRLENVILWDDVLIEKGSSLKDCIVADGMNISGIHSRQVHGPGPCGTMIAEL